MSDRSNAVNAWVNKNIMPIAAKIGAFKPLPFVMELQWLCH